MTTLAGAPRPAYRLDCHVAPGNRATSIAGDVRIGLGQTPRSLSPKYFYDERGCDLFEQITRLPEYYQTRTELAILRDIAPALIARHAPNELVELGSGSSTKTSALLDPMADDGFLRRYVPFDIAPEALLAAAARVAGDYPGLEIHAVAGDFGIHLDRIPTPTEDRRLVAFLGGTIGNFRPAERHAFLLEVRGLLSPGDLVLIGTDLVGDVRRTEAAYNDSRGITAAFNRNVLRVVNGELGGNFVPANFEHVARFEAEPAWIEMRLRARSRQYVRLEALEMDIEIAAGEEILTEISAKFTRDQVDQMYADSGFALSEWHTDGDQRFAVSVAIAVD